MRRKIQGRVLDKKAVKIAMIQNEVKIGQLAEALALSKMSVNSRINGKTPCRLLELDKLVELLKTPADTLAAPAPTPETN